MTSYSEIHTDQELEFSVVILNPEKDPIEALPELPVLERDGKHVRGTFPEGNRTFHVNQVLGSKPQRMIIGDNDLDTFVTGSDSVTGLEEVNIGNTGVLYDIELRVAPHTLVGLNARGGHYAGAFLVNGKVVNMLDGSILINPEEVGVLHRQEIKKRRSICPSCWPREAISQSICCSCRYRKQKNRVAFSLSYAHPI